MKLLRIQLIAARTKDILGTLYVSIEHIEAIIPTANNKHGEGYSTEIHMKSGTTYITSTPCDQILERLDEITQSTREAKDG
jgi:hypothetical protein